MPIANVMNSPIGHGSPPVLSAVVHIHRTHDILRDGAPPDGCVFIGPPHLPPAKQSLAWLTHHGYTVVRTEYFSDAAQAVAQYPQVSLDIGDHVRAEGAAILASDPSLRFNESIPRSTTGSQPYAFSVPRSMPFPPPTQAWEEDASSATPLVKRAPMNDGHTRDISRSDFEALFQKTAMLHDRLDQVLEQQQKQSRTRSTWTECASLLPAGEEDEEEEQKDFTHTGPKNHSNSTYPRSARASFYQDYIPDGTSTTIQYELPESTYSLLISADVFSLPFNVGLLACTLSLMCLSLVLADEFDKKNPGNSLVLPAGLHPSVQVAQYLGIIIGRV